jgi:hypothetical protein
MAQKETKRNQLEHPNSRMTIMAHDEIGLGPDTVTVMLYADFLNIYLQYLSIVSKNPQAQANAAAVRCAASD